MKKLGRTARKAAAVLTVFALMLLSFPACNNSGSTEPTDELVLYTNFVNQDIINYAIEQFKAAYPEVNVVVENFPSMEDLEEYTTTLQTELAAGAGPDLIVDMGEIFDPYKTGQSGAFANIDDFIAADPDFDLSGYNEMILETGIIDGNRYYVPLSYYLQYVLTTEENLDYFDVNITADSSFEEIAAELAAFCEQNKDNTAVDWTKDLFFQMSQFFPWSGVELVNYETKEVTVDTEDFRSLMELYKAIYPMDWVRYPDKDADDPWSYTTLPEEIANHRYLLSFETSTLILSRQCIGLLETTGQTPVFFDIGMEEETVAAPTSLAAINHNGRNQYNAYRFLKILLGETSQLQNTVQNDIPVLESAAVSRLETLFDADDQEKVLSEEFRGEIIERSTTNVTVNQGFNYQMKDFVWEHMEPYFKGEKDYDSCLTELENKLQLYLSE